MANANKYLLPLKIQIHCDECGKHRQLTPTNLGNLCVVCMAPYVNEASKHLALARTDAAMALFYTAYRGRENGE